MNPKIERRKVIHLHAETHSLGDPDYVVVATNDIEEEFRMENFDKETNQHYVCKASHDEDSVDMGENDANFPLKFVQSSGWRILTKKLTSIMFVKLPMTKIP